MTRINRGSFVKKYIDGLKLDPTTGSMPVDASDKSVLTFDFSNLVFTEFVKFGNLANTSAVDIFITSSTADTYVTSVNLTYYKDAGATTGMVSVLAYVDGVVTRLAQMYTNPSTANNGTIAISFPKPVKLDRNTQVQVFSLTAVANINASASIGGFLVE